MVFAALIIGWVLVASAMAILCVAARRGDAGDEVRRADAALSHLPTRLSA
jgi:hypothetical protein